MWGTILIYRHSCICGLFGNPANSLVRILAVSLLLVSGLATAASRDVESGEWQLLSLPGDSTAPVGSLFGDSLPADEINNTWAVFTFDTTSFSYRALSATDQIEPSDAFWFVQLTGQSVTIDLALEVDSPALEISEICTSASGCIEHELTATGAVGWTMVGAPFMQSVPVDQIRLVTSDGPCAQGCNMIEAASVGLTNGIFYAYDAARQAYAEIGVGDSLQSEVGYWFANTLPAGYEGARLLIPSPVIQQQSSVFEKATALGTGMNLGNALEAPQEGDWGLFLEAYYFDRIAEAGFDSVRVPIRWSTHALQSAPYTIEPNFFERIDWVLEQTERTGLATVINMHHYEALMASPETERERFLALWAQIAERYRDLPESVFFEMLNEPTDAFNETPALWNELLVDVVQQVRVSNPERALIVGPVGWNAIDRLPQFSLPQDDQLITTVHFYSPFEFTHQGADWVDPIPPLGANFNSDSNGLGGAYQNWSWDTAVTFGTDGMQVSYAVPFAGLNFRLLATEAPTLLSAVVSGNTDVSVGCSLDGDFTYVGEIVHEGVLPQSYTVDLSACGADVETVALQNRVEGAAAMTIVAGEICAGSDCYQLLETAGDAIRSQLQQAAMFGQVNNTPVYVGEFGAYSTADIESRADWTATVQDSARSLGMSTAYWEFGAGFGAFDIENDQWRGPLLGALIR